MGSIVVPYASVQEAFQENPAALQDVVEKSATDAAGGDPEERARLIAQWHEALASMERADQGPTVLSTPKNALGARLQTMLAQQAAESGQLATLQAAITVSTDAGISEAVESVQVKFDNNDLVGWLGTGLRILFKPPSHPWIPPSPVPEPLADDARIAVFGDWGTGLYGAPVITKSIEALDRCDVVLHLGDTYYSGGDEEVADRLIGDWPRRGSATRNRALNGNHEMYSGGLGYFAALKTFFGQQSSCFAMQNTHWLLVGLDTAYKDFDLDRPQVEWLTSLIAASGTRKVVLFSHHQPFSSLDDQGPHLQIALADLLQRQRIHAWFWGHEHRLVLYDPHSTWGFKGRCVGHGGFPAFRDTAVGANGNIYQWIRLAPRPHAPKAQLLDGPNLWIADAPDQYAPNGYLMLELDGDRAWETYRTPDNIAISGRLQL